MKPAPKAREMSQNLPISKRRNLRKVRNTGTDTPGFCAFGFLCFRGITLSHTEGLWQPCIKQIHLAPLFQQQLVTSCLCHS